ncbi:MAG: hypothetical protein GXP62_20110 [Oligoflexia bacterium]|nr:hypothetical protein [Oligoflexia bacterium]
MRRALRRTLRHLADLPGLVALLALCWWLFQTVVPRLSYPFDLEWMEGGMLVHALRVSQGQALYTLPSADWIPYLYPPLYPWVVGALGTVFGVDYDVGRMVSLVGVAAAALALVVAIRREGGSVLLGMGTAALFLSTYEDSGTFFDLVRADGLLIGLLAWALVAVRSDRVVAGGLLLVLAWLAKHNAAIFGLPMLVWLWRYRSPALAKRFALASLIPALVVLAWLEIRTGGLFLVYLLAVPLHHDFVLQRFFPGAPQELFGAMPLALGLLVLAALAWLLAAWRGRASPSDEPERTQGRIYWSVNIALAVLLCMLMRGHQGGYLNVLVPGHWALALGCGLGAVGLRRVWDHPVVVLSTALVLGGSAWQGRWEIAPLLPTQADRAAGDVLIARIAAIDGPVFVPHAPWYPVKAGKAPSLPLISLWDIDHPGGALASYAKTVDQALAEHHWAAVILADRKFGHGLTKFYRPNDTIRYTGSALFPKTGWHVRPRYVYLPR